MDFLLESPNNHNWKEASNVVGALTRNIINNMIQFGQWEDENILDQYV